ncbi:MAG TPA: hypothetical protein VN924_10660 [Bryobacteraceae bacterium]|nr:hypothetical protein [Bryobacteraceae bacterium]
MRSHTFRLISTALLAAAFGTVQAQAKPNLGGNWKLNAAKSDFGAMPAPNTRTDTITHDDPDLRDVYTQSGQMGQFTAEMKYSTDGKETTSSVRGNEIKTTAKWDGDDLTIAGKAQFNGADVTLNDRWSLSADGKTLTIQRHVNSPMGATDQKIVLEKQ